MAAQPNASTTLQQVITEAEKPKPRPPSSEQVSIGFFSEASFVLLNRAAAMYAASSLVPDAYRNNVPNCAIALNMSRRMNADPLMVMQNLYIVYGNPGWSSKFLIATLNESGRWSALRYEFKGTPGQDDWGCRAWSIEKSTGEKIEGPWVTMKIVKAEGWYDRKDKNGNYVSKWRTMPELMFMYRSAAWFIRAYDPGLAMGLGTAEEHLDMGPLMDEVLQKTEERLKEEQAARLAAIDKAPSKLDALVNAAKATEGANVKQAAPAQETPKTPEAPKDKPADKPKASGKTKQEPPKQETVPAAGSTYSDHEDDPFKTGELNF